MAEGFWARLFGLDSSDEETSIDTTGTTSVATPKTEDVTLQDAITFVTELQSYYFNDICKMQADLTYQADLTQNQINFSQKKITQDQVALAQIDEVLNSIRKIENEYQTIWKKSIYSFYDEIEKKELNKAEKEVFTAVLHLCEINTKPELDDVIGKRIKKYKDNWEINEAIELPKNTKAILISEQDGIEEYRFGNFSKKVVIFQNERVLSPKQLDKIMKISFQFPQNFPTSIVWVHVASVTRAELNFMRRTCIMRNNWEEPLEDASKLYFDQVKVVELEYYLRGVLQIVLKRTNHAVVTIVIPTANLISKIGPTEQIEENKIRICKNLRFVLNERSYTERGYGNNMITARIDRRNIPEVLEFIPYLQFKKEYF